VVGVDALDMPGAPQRLQTAQVRADEGVRVFALPFEGISNELKMPARLIDAGPFLGHEGDVPVGVSRPRDGWGGLDDHALPHLLDRRRAGEFHVMDPAVNAIDDEVDALAHLVAGQSFPDHPAGDTLARSRSVKDVLRDTPFVGEVMVRQRSMDGIYGVVVRLQSLECGLDAIGDNQAPGPGLGREAIAFQALHPVDEEVTVFPDQIGQSLARPKINEAMLPLLGDQHPVEPRQPFCVDLAGKLLGHVDLALVTQFPGHEFARPVADPVGDVVAGDVQNFAVAGDAAHDDVGVGMAGVVVVDGDPVEAGVEVLLDLPHQVPREAAQVAQFRGKLDAVLGGDARPPHAVETVRESRFRHHEFSSFGSSIRCWPTERHSASNGLQERRTAAVLDQLRAHWLDPHPRPLPTRGRGGVRGTVEP
jgi:hypothetical protein